jgi:outer membrane protein OmpA-like peptidoglycan-associated protein
MSIQAWLGYPLRSVLTFAAALALFMLFAVLPLQRGLAWTVAGVVVAAWAVSWALCTWQHAAARRTGAAALAELDTVTADLPLRLRTRMLLMLVTGDALAGIFGGATAHGRKALVRNGAIWLRIDRPQDLPRVAAAAKEWRDGRAPDGLVLCIAPAGHPNEETLVQTLRSARQAASDAARLLRVALPCHVAVYQRLAGAPGDAPQWYGIAAPKPLADFGRFDEMIEAAADDLYRRTGDRHAMLNSAARAAALASLVGWTRRVVLGPLVDARQPASLWRLHGACWIDHGPASDAQNPWAQAVSHHASVALPFCDASPTPWPLPEPIVESLAQRAWMSPRIRALAHALALTALAAALAIWGAAKNNQTLLARIGADISRFRAIPAGHEPAQHDALQTLIAERDQLDRYARTGVPLRLSFGMYRGAALVPALDAAIASYQPPPPAPPPSIVTLDSMSLFDAGKSVLKAGSTRALVGALEMIRANPDKRVVVAGHTDNTGTADGNLPLSVARATAVRDWLVDASGLSATRFAIQGYGDTRPVAPNDTDIGRARNRRVEITLIPDCQDDRAASPAGVAGSRSTPGQPACS